MKRFLTFDPLNLPSSRRLVERSSNQGRQDDGTSSRSPELDMTGHSASRHDDYDSRSPELDMTGHSASRHDYNSDSDSCNGDASDDTWGVGLRNRRRSSTSVQAPSQLHRSKEEVEGAGTQFQVRTKLGQTVHWTTQYHYSTEELEQYRHVGDVEMDRLLDLCASEGVQGAGRFDDIVRASTEAAEHCPRKTILHRHHRPGKPWPTFIDIIPPRHPLSTGTNFSVALTSLSCMHLPPEHRCTIGRW